MKFGQRTTTATLSLVLLACLLAIASAPTARVRYHLWRLEATHNAIYTQPTDVLPNGLAAFGNQKLFDRLNYHRDALVDLGVLFRATYTFEEIDRFEGGPSALYRLIIARTVALSGEVDTELPYFEGSHPTGPWTIWDYTKNKQGWDAFFNRHNTPRFADEQAELIQDVLSKQSASQG